MKKCRVCSKYKRLWKPEQSSDGQTSPNLRVSQIFKKKYIQPKILLILQYTTDIKHKLHNISR